MIYGYARVSTQDQDLTTQRQALAAAGCEHIYAEKMSGARSDRPELAAVLRTLQRGDVLVVTRLDRLARSTVDLLTILKRVEAAGAGFKSIAETWVDTSTPMGRLLVTFLGGIAEFERHLIRERTDAGRKRAKAEGRRIGGPTPRLADQMAQAASLVASGATISAAAKAAGISRGSVRRALKA